MSLPTRQIGKNGPQVPAIGFGLMVMTPSWHCLPGAANCTYTTQGLSAFYGAIESDEDRFKVLDRAVELGATFWDTADVYLDSEDLVGKWFKRTGKRDEIFLATKFGVCLDTLKWARVAFFFLTCGLTVCLVHSRSWC